MSDEPLKAPELPDGYRFRVSIDSDRDVVVRIEKRVMRKRWFRAPSECWERCGSPHYIPQRTSEATRERVYAAMDLKRRILEHELQQESFGQQFVGCYPPKENL